MMRAFPDLTDLIEDAAMHTRHPEFDAAMRALCRGLADFHAAGSARRSGVVDTITFAVAVLVL